MAREFFCAYHSYLDFMQELGDAECGRLFKACLEYSKTGATPELRGNERFVFAGIKTQIDRDKEEYKKKCERNSNNRKRPLTTVNETAQGEGEGKGEREGDCYYPPSPLAAVMTAYMEKVNPTPSQMSMDELKAYAENMGAEVCLRAIDIALDARKANWNYIRAILRDKQKQGVKCLADWDALDAKREKETTNANGVTHYELPML